jgi:hypothetical protein
MESRHRSTSEFDHDLCKKYARRLPPVKRLEKQDPTVGRQIWPDALTARESLASAIL